MELEKVKELAGTYRRLMLVPVLTTSDLSRLVGVKETTLRQWIKRGHVELRNSERPGPGRAMLFSSADTLEVMAIAEISRLGLPLDTFARSVAEIIMSTALKKMGELAGDYGPWKDEWRHEMSYVILFYSPLHGGHEWSQSSFPCPYPPNPLVATWVVIDCFALAMRALEFLDTLKKKDTGEFDD